MHFVYLGVLCLLASVYLNQNHVLFVGVWFNMSLLGNLRPIQMLRTGQPESNILSDLMFFSPKPLFPHFKTPTAPDHFVLMHSNRFASNSALPIYFFPSAAPPRWYRAMQSENPQLSLNIVNLFIKQCVQYIFMVHISLVKTVRSIKHLGDHWTSLQRADSSPGPLALLVPGSWSHIIQSIRHIQLLLDKPVLVKGTAGHSPCWELELNT